MVPHKCVPFTDHHAFASFSPCVLREEAWFHGTFFFVSSLSTNLWLLTEEWKKVFITWPLTSSNVSRLLLRLIHQWARPSLSFLHTCARGATAWSKGFLLYGMDVVSKYKEIYLFQTSALKFFSHVKFHSFPVVIFRHKSLFLCLLVKVPHWMKIMLNCSPRNPTFFNSGLSHQSFTSKSPVSFS